MKQLIAILLILQFVLLFFSCSRRPFNILPEDEFEKVLYDVQLAQAIYSSQPDIYNSKEKKDALVAAFLSRHDLAQAQFDSTLVWYSDNDIETYRTIADSVGARFRREGNQLRQYHASVENYRKAKDGDIFPSIIYLDATKPIVSFNIDTIKIKTIKPEKFNWTFSVLGLRSGEKLSGEVIYEYRDTIIWNRTDIDENKSYEFTKPTLPDSLLRSINGYVRLMRDSISQKANVILYDVKTEKIISDTLSQSVKNDSSKVDKDMVPKPVERRSLKKAIQEEVIE